MKAAYANEIDELDLSAAEVPRSRPQSVSMRVEAMPPAPTSEPEAIIQMIERLARDPTADLDKFERLLKMRDDIENKAAEKAFNIAMKDAQAEMRPISADAHNPQTRSKYATYAKLDGVLRPVYTKHGFSLSFDEADSPKPEHIRVLCYVSHEAGHTRTYRKDMPADGKGAKGGDVMTKTHAAGAASSYGARYLLKGIFNIAVGEDDRDGNDIPRDQESTISAEQVAELRRLFQEHRKSEAKFLVWAQIEKLEDIPAHRFYDARRAISGGSK